MPKKKSTEKTRVKGQITKKLPPIDRDKIPWMVLGEVSCRRNGSCNVLVVSQHGCDEDDTNTEKVACWLAEELDSFAVVNNQKWHKGKKKGEKRHVADLNDPDEARRCKEFWSPLMDRVNHLSNKWPKPPIVLFIHGIDDGNIGEDDVFVIGAGYNDQYDEKTATASKPLIETFRNSLTVDIGRALDGLQGYGAKTRVPTVFRAEFGDGAVEAIQLEIRYKGFRDTEKNIKTLVQNLANVITHDEMKEFFTTEKREKPLPPEAPDFHELSTEGTKLAAQEINRFEGNSNILIVAPNLAAQYQEEMNIGLLAYRLAEELESSAVINFKLYRQPTESDPPPPRPESEDVSDTKQEGTNVSIRNYQKDRFEKSGGNPVDLNVWDEAWNYATGYAEAVGGAVEDIAESETPLVFFLRGVDQAKAEELDFDVALGAGLLSKHKTSSTQPMAATADRSLVDQILERLKAMRNGLRVGEGVEGYALETKDNFFRVLREKFINPDKTEDGSEPKEPLDVNVVQLTLAYTGIRESEANLKKSVKEIAEAIRGLEEFKPSVKEGELVEKRIEPVAVDTDSEDSSFQTLPISNIKIGERVRKDLGDLSGLIASIEKTGLLHPVVVRKSDHWLIGGFRRLEAHKAMGRTKIPVHLIDVHDVLRGEHDENMVRKNFLPSEAVAITRLVEPELREEAEQRKTEGRKKGGRGKKKHGAKLAPSSVGRVRNQLEAYTGWKRSTFKKIREVADAAAEESEKYQAYLDEMDQTGRIEPVYRKFKKIREKEPDKAGLEVLAGAEKDHTFNAITEKIEWAKWTWNPVTGCEHGCLYCYARETAERVYADLPKEVRFKPRLLENRLAAPQNTKIPEKREDEPGIRHVFVCTMADLFGDWVDQDWIDRVLKVCGENTDWTYIFLTKNPERLPKIRFPDNCWVGATVDTQKRVKPSLKALKEVKAAVRFISCEPLLEDLSFPALEAVDWVIIGGQRKTMNQPASQPRWEWVRHVEDQARKQSKPVYFKPSLDFEKIRPKEYPE